MDRPLPLLCAGRYEPLKAAVHGVVLGTAAVCAAYNIAAWLARRKRHLAVNAGLYSALVVWEWIHVRHHIDCLPMDVNAEKVDAEKTEGSAA